ncbi:hypothetical protein Barb4_00961 [Bacteroidales bacterium Barb4]|nr:hypothetical protein Barb4_00961 [Bacteroidales bacterium Barb4]
MEWKYINEFHKDWMERSRQSIEYWKAHPMSLEDVKKQQEMLNRQRAAREGRCPEGAKDFSPT